MDDMDALTAVVLFFCGLLGVFCGLPILKGWFSKRREAKLRRLL